MTQILLCLLTLRSSRPVTSTSHFKKCEATSVCCMQSARCKWKASANKFDMKACKHNINIPSYNPSRRCCTTYWHSQLAVALITSNVLPNVLNVMRPTQRCSQGCAQATTRFVSATVCGSTQLSTHAHTGQTPAKLRIPPISIYRTILISD